MTSTSEAVALMASTTGQIITDSVPLLYYMIALFLVGMTLMFFMKAIKKTFYHATR